MLKFCFSGRIVTSASKPDDISDVSSEVLEYLKSNSHKHDFKEIMTVVRGGCVLKLKNKYFRLNEGDIVLLNSMEEHTEGHYADSNSVYYWGSFWSDMLRIHVWATNKIADSGFLSLGTFNDFIYHLWDELSTEKNNNAEEEFAHIATSFINNFLRCGGQKNNLFPNNMRYDIMKKIIEYIENMPSLNCTLDSLSILSGYSKVHFQRCFAEYTGMNSREYLLRKRVERYFRIIGRKDYSLKEMAYELGFASSAALLHWKKRNQKRFHL